MLISLNYLQVLGIARDYIYDNENNYCVTTKPKYLSDKIFLL